jgi:hypothetical protein
MPAVAMSAAALLGGCRQDMHNQPKYIPLRSSSFFADGRSARMPVPGTVARGELKADTYFYTGKVNGQDGTLFPFPVTREVLLRGRERYNIYCTPCHSRVGDGNGMIVQRGYRRAASFHDPKLVAAPVGHFFDVMTNGWGAMPDYSAQIDAQDRWAIAAYIRALQLSQNATLAEVPANEQSKIMTREQLADQFENGEAGVEETSPMTTSEGTMGGKAGSANTRTGVMQPTKGGTGSNDINRDYNEQSGGQVIRSARPNPAGQAGHPSGGDTVRNTNPYGGKGGPPKAPALRGQSALPNGNWQSGPNQRTPQTGQAQPQGDSREPK